MMEGVQPQQEPHWPGETTASPSASASLYQLFVCSFSHCSVWIWLHRCCLCPYRKRGWPTARRLRRPVPPLCPRCSTGCSWMTTWKQTSGTPTLPRKPATCLSLWMTRRSTSLRWRPTSPTESPPRSAIGCWRGNTRAVRAVEHECNRILGFLDNVWARQSFSMLLNILEACS